MNNNDEARQIGRRAFVRGSALVLGASSVLPQALLGDEARTSADDGHRLKVGMVTDLHYADKPTAGSRHYRETLAKLDQAAGQFLRDEPDFVVELGDLIDRADSVETEQRYLKTINKEFSAICKDRHYVLGNHCVDTLKKEEFLGTVGQQKSFYSFDRGDFHFVVLDSCFRSDGQPYGRKNFKWTDANIPAAEIDWLQSDLKASNRKTIVFAHQRLDVSNNHGVKNCAEVRAALETSGNVLAVFQGHSHKNDLKEISGIHYCTLVAMVEGAGVENSGHAMMTLGVDDSIVVDGFRKQSDYRWATPAMAN
ncbi:metallophosphoesterase family protein [Stieleria marina]|uniref:3',5'-cyclic adenosine monophosphate phosphodiesterase CpdA n=1 Tax=Stieleria marina TaxID=1930275 RepID=A0A517NZW2_9BACT|nr:3',5'-cyclic adenosine monophosphate phosphodiesterase CpdA [Planctomycetes bacterium K23_9]